MTMYGLYQPYKVNRPLTKQEKNNQFRQGRYRKVKYFNCARSVIRMNSTYLETVDKFYARKGQDNAWWLIVFLMTVGIILYVFIRSVMDIPRGGYPLFWRMMIGCLLFSGLTIFTGVMVFKEWFKWTHYPIRFNRQNGMVYVFRTNGTVLSAPWKEIFFTQEKDPGPLREWCIRGHILDKDGEMVLETFSLGFCENKASLPEYWEFIRCYMEEDCVEDLAELVVICPPVENRKEGFVFGLQNLFYMESRLEWLFLPVTLLLNIDGSVARYIAMQTSKIPQWPQEVQDACKPDIDDSVNVSADNNPKDKWRLVFANQKYEDWKTLYEKMECATNRIHAALAERYSV